MKAIKVATISLIIIIICLFFIRIYLINYEGSLLYFLGVSREHGVGYVEAEKFADLSTEKLLKIMEDNKNFKEYPRTHYEGHVKFGRYIGAIKVLGSKTDKKALAKLTDIIRANNEGDKWDAISSIGRYKNKAMIPVLCEALKAHTDSNTDRIIVKALINIDDVSALDCFKQEKDKIKWKDYRSMAEKAIEKWTKETTMLRNN